MSASVPPTFQVQAPPPIQIDEALSILNTIKGNQRAQQKLKLEEAKTHALLNQQGFDVTDQGVTFSPQRLAEMARARGAANLAGVQDVLGGLLPPGQAPQVTPTAQPTLPPTGTDSGLTTTPPLAMQPTPQPGEIGVPRITGQLKVDPAVVPGGTINVAPSESRQADVTAKTQAGQVGPSSEEVSGALRSAGVSNGLANH